MNKEIIYDRYIKGKTEMLQLHLPTGLKARIKYKASLLKMSTNEYCAKVLVYNTSEITSKPLNIMKKEHLIK